MAPARATTKQRSSNVLIMKTGGPLCRAGPHSPYLAHVFCHVILVCHGASLQTLNCIQLSSEIVFSLATIRYAQQALLSSSEAISAFFWHVYMAACSSSVCKRHRLDFVRKPSPDFFLSRLFSPSQALGALWAPQCDCPRPSLLIAMLCCWHLHFYFGNNIRKEDNFEVRPHRLMLDVSLKESARGCEWWWVSSSWFSFTE
jgi:hypothetical protein